MTDTANYGTNNSNGWKDNSTAPSYGGSAPSRSDTILVTTYTWNADGRQEEVADPRDIDTKKVFDALGRVTEIREDFNGSDERVTAFEYDGLGTLTKRTADLTTDQVTEYVTDTTQNARWITEIHYPDPSTGAASSASADKVVMTYNVDGMLKDRTDQTGTKLTWSYDVRRRKTEEEVTTVGTGVDSTVRAITYTYTDDGRVEYTTSHSDTTPDTTEWADATRQIKRRYTSFGKMDRERQDWDSKTGDNSGIDTRAVNYGFDYSSANNYQRLNYVEYPDGRKFWRGYTHKDADNTFQDTINDKFSRVGQIAVSDPNGDIGDLIAQYDFNGLGRMVRRTSEEDTGWNGNDTQLDLYGTVSGQYDGYDRLGRIAKMTHKYIGDSGFDIVKLEYSYDRAGNPTDITDEVMHHLSIDATYDNLNRLTEYRKGEARESAFAGNIREKFTFGDDLNITDKRQNGTDAGCRVQEPTLNATNEITSWSVPNPAADPIGLDDDFSDPKSYWAEDKGDWTIDGEISCGSRSSGEAWATYNSTLDDCTFQAVVNFPVDSEDEKAGLIFSFDGDDTFYAVVLDKKDEQIALHKITDGSWGAALASASATISNETDYTVMVVRRQRHVEAEITNQSGTDFTYDGDDDFGTGSIGFYTTKNDVTFDDFK